MDFKLFGVLFTIQKVNIMIYSLNKLSMKNFVAVPKWEVTKKRKLKVEIFIVMVI